MTDFTTGAPTHRLPTLIRTRLGYRIHDPALINDTAYVIDDVGDLVYTRLPAGVMTAGAVLGSALVSVIGGANIWGRSVVLFLVCLPTAFALAILALSLIHMLTDPVRGYRSRFGHTRFAFDVHDRDSPSWQLCVRAERLAASPSWQAGRIDPTRTLGGLLWTAVADGEPWAAEAVADLTEPATGPNLTPA